MIRLALMDDFDSIITSDVGINLQPPKNLNTILCHMIEN